MFYISLLTCKLPFCQGAITAGVKSSHSQDFLSLTSLLSAINLSFYHILIKVHMKSDFSH